MGGRFRYARALAAAVAVMFVAEVALRVAGGALPEPLTWYNHFAQAKAHQLEVARAHHRSYDIVFVGDSSTERGLDPDRFTERDECQRSAYNAAIPGATPDELEPWVTKIVVPRVHPTSVVFGVTSRFLNDAADTGGSFAKSLAMRSGLLGRIDRWAHRNIALVRYRRSFTDGEELRRTIDELLPGRKPDEPWNDLRPNGFAPIGHQVRYGVGEFRDAGEHGVLRDYEVSDHKLASLRRVVTSLQEAGIDVVFARLPVSDDWIGLHPHGASDVAKFDRALGDIASALDVEIVDLTSVAPGARHELFRDTIHLSDAGTELVTDELALVLGERC